MKALVSSVFVNPCGFLSQISSSICLLRGKIYDAMDNRPLATSSYKEALKLDVYCFEAFDLLTSHHMLTAQEGETDSFYIQAGCSVIILLYLYHSAIETFQWREIIYLSVVSLQKGISWTPFLLANNVPRRKRSCYAFFMKIS